MYIKAPICCHRISGPLPRATIVSPKLGDCLEDPSVVLGLALCFNVKQQDTAFFLMQDFVRALSFDSRRLGDHSGL
jgi:hypothetical protein